MLNQDQIMEGLECDPMEYGCYFAGKEKRKVIWTG